MFWSKTFIPTLKETPQEAESISHQLMLRAGLVRMLMAGVYSYLPLGFKVLDNIQRIIRQEMDSCGASEVLLPALQPLDLWQKSSRDKDMGEVLVRFVDRRGRKLCLGPTHEEVITELVKNHISSYKELPLILYQIQTKFRDEIRPRFGLVRSCEFIMKDAYSFDKDEAGLDKNYRAMYDAYRKIFKRCGLEILTTEADPGVMGGRLSHEFMVEAKDGEDIVLLCPKCKSARTYSPPPDESMAGKEKEDEACVKCGAKLDRINTIEVGHIFKLGTKYSLSLSANFLDCTGKLKPIIMGCYGIGVSRLTAGIIEQNHDQEGIIWPLEIAPYEVVILPLDVTEKKIMKNALDIYKKLIEGGIEVLLDDRDERAGVKFKDADLIGIPINITIGQKNLKDKKVEIKTRRDKKVFLVSIKNTARQIKEILK